MKSPFEIELNKLGINHKLIPPRTPWHNGKVEKVIETTKDISMIGKHSEILKN